MRLPFVIAALALAGCGGAAAPAAPAPGAAPEAAVALTPPGSRLSLRVPDGLERVPHTLRFRDADRGFGVTVSDATVQPGRERGVAEDYFARLRELSDGAVEARPVVLRGHEGLDLTVRGARERLRVLTIWHDGAVARLVVRHRPQDARAAERVMDSVRFDPEAPIDPLAALDLAGAPVEGLSLLPVSNEQLLFREGREPVAFPSAEATLDAVWVPFAEGRRPDDDRARGELLGSRFAGLRLEPPRLTPVEQSAFAGYELVTATAVEGRELMLYGAYLEGARGALLVRASVAADRAEAWRPRFAALVRSLRPRPGAPRDASR